VLYAVASCDVLCQVPAEVQGSWKALRALCWCDDELARLASRHWLQQLLAVTLQQSLKVGQQHQGTTTTNNNGSHVSRQQQQQQLPLPGNDWNRLVHVRLAAQHQVTLVCQPGAWLLAPEGAWWLARLQQFKQQATQPRHICAPLLPQL